MIHSASAFYRPGTSDTPSVIHAGRFSCRPEVAVAAVVYPSREDRDCCYIGEYRRNLRARPRIPRGDKSRAVNRTAYYYIIPITGHRGTL